MQHVIVHSIVASVEPAATDLDTFLRHVRTHGAGQIQKNVYPKNLIFACSRFSLLVARGKVGRNNQHALLFVYLFSKPAERQLQQQPKSKTI